MLTAFCARLRNVRAAGSTVSGPSDECPHHAHCRRRAVGRRGRIEQRCDIRARHRSRAISSVLGYITAVTLPPIGPIVGIVLGTCPAKGSSRHWMSIIVVSIIGAVLQALVFGSGALTSTSNDPT